MRRAALVAVAALAPTLALAQRAHPAPPAVARRTAAPPTVGPLDSALWSGLRWRMIGPARGGRVTAVAGVASQPYTFYMGATGGGVWKTTDAGETWVNVTDPYFDTGSIGAIRVADSDPNVVWVGTGSEAIRSNVSIGRGVWRSTDAGAHWTFLGLRDVGQIGAIAVHPTNPDVAWVAAMGNPFATGDARGIYRTTDGGRSWRKVLFVSDSTGAVDVELNPADPNTLYAAMWRAQRTPWTIISGAREGGIYRSTDGGETWAKLAGGLPAELVGKIDITVTAADPRRVYALIEAAPGGGLYRSDDGGDHWALVNTTPALLFRPFYYTDVHADPKNPDHLWVNDESFFESADGGKTFVERDTPHGDNHDMWISPVDPQIMIQANDGGANVSLDGGRTWSTQYNQPTAEIYQVATDDQWPYRVYGAQQDQNKTLIVPSLPPVSYPIDDPIQLWRSGPGCETGPVLPHPTNPDTVYGACKGQFSVMNRRTGQEKNYWIGAQFMYGHNPKDLIYRFQRVSPIEISPHDPRVIYMGSQYVHRTTDGGVTWARLSPDLTANEPSRQVVSGGPITRDITGEEFYSTLYTIRESPVARGVIWTGANDGPVFVTRDDGKTWTNVTPKDLPPGGRVQNIEPSPLRAGAAYVAVLRYLLGDFRPYLYATNDYGRTWRLLTDGTNGIPADEPTRVVREDPDRAGLLVAGTEFGIYVSFDDGAHWQSLRRNLPVTPVTDLRFTRGDLVISTQGRSFWIMHDITPLEQATPAVAASPAHLFAPRPAIRWRYERPEGTAAPEYPAAGAPVDVWVRGDARDSVRLEIVDARGRVVRRLEGCEGNRGVHHRLTWDLRWPGPWSPRPTRSSAGPMVAPGTYRVGLVVGDRVEEHPVVVRADPRVLADGVTQRDLVAQEAHNLRVRDAISDANRLVVRIDSARARLAGAGQASGGSDGSHRLDSLRARLVTASGRYQQPMLIAQLEYLYGMTTGADQRVGRDAIERFATLRRELDRAEAEYRSIVGAASSAR